MPGTQGRGVGPAARHWLADGAGKGRRSAGVRRLAPALRLGAARPVRTEVTLTYDWSAVPQFIRDRGSSSRRSARSISPTRCTTWPSLPRRRPGPRPVKAYERRLRIGYPPFDAAANLDRPSTGDGTTAPAAMSLNRPMDFPKIRSDGQRALSPPCSIRPYLLRKSELHLSGRST
jgi:hypothetical protein